MNAGLRKTNCEAFGDVLWGTHLCLFYETKEDLIDILAPYVKAGLEQSELCVWAASAPLPAVEAKLAIRQHIPNIETYLERGQIEFFDDDQWYLKSGVFDVERVLQDWIAKEQAALQRGFDGLRLTGNTFWLEANDCQAFMAYEARMDSIIDQHRILAICTYVLEKCSAHQVIELIGSHEYALIRRAGRWQTIENPRRQKAEEALRISERRYRNLFDTMADAMLLADDDARYVDVNPAACELFGYSREEFLQLSVWDITPIPDRAQGTALWQAFIAAGAQQEQYTITRKDGQERVLDYRAVANIVPGLHLSVLRDITEHKQAEESLKQYQQIVSSTPDGIALLDREYRYKLVNNAYETFSGTKPERLLGLTIAEYLGDDVFRRYVKPLFDRCLHGETIEYQEWFDYPASGKRFVHVTYFPYRDAQQNIVGIVANTRDVTEIKAAEEALRQSEERFRAIADYTYDWEIWVAPDGALRWTNPDMERLTGYASQDVVNLLQWLPTLVFPDDQDTVLTPLAQALPQRLSANDCEFRIRCKDGSIRWVSLSYQPIYAEHGEYLGLRGSVRDITDRKRMELALQEREALYRQMFLGHSAVKLLIDPATGAIVEANPAAAQFYGYSVETLQQMNITQINILPPAQIAANLAETQTRRSNYFVFQHGLADGTIRDVEVYAVPITVHERTLLYAIIHDITERKQAEAELQRHRGHLEELILARTQELQTANQQLAREIEERRQIEDVLHKAKEAAETANRAKSRFLANMSHELRSPLNAILGFSQLLERSPDTTAQQREHLELINRSGEHLLELINDVLELSKIETGQIALTMTTVDLRHTLTDLEMMLHVRADQKGLRLLFEMAADVPRHIQTDQRKLRQILINLLENAVKFTDVGQVTLRVRCASPEPHADRVTLRFEVSDTGVGIAAAELSRVFDVFSQTASGQQQTEGAGLGLALSRQFAQVLGGEITAVSQPGAGSAFTLILPAQPAAAEQSLPRPARRVVGLAPAQPEYRILVVDDDVENHLFFGGLLQELGFNVQAVDNGAQAITVYKEWQPHLILMDIRMPVMDGYAATQEIRKLEAGNSEKFERANSEHSTSNFQFRIPIVAVTASAFEEERAAILAAGCNDFVRKPFWGDDILAVIQRHLGVQYQYAEPGRSRNVGQSPEGERTGDIARLSERIAALAPDVRATLERAAFESDVEALDDLFVHIRESDAPLADALTQLAKDFKYDEIMRLIQETKHDGEHEG